MAALEGLDDSSLVHMRKNMRLYHSDAKEEKRDSETVSSVETFFVRKLDVHNIIIIQALHICYVT